MRILGIDYGSKRIGIAVSDEAAQFALPVSVVKNSDTAISEIVEIARQHAIQEIVMGESRNYKGEPNTIFLDSLTFKGLLEKEGYTVRLEPEFMTSMNAERFQGKNELHDASAAALILQSFLDTRRNSA